MVKRRRRRRQRRIRMLEEERLKAIGKLLRKSIISSAVSLPCSFEMVSESAVAPIGDKVLYKREK